MTDAAPAMRGLGPGALPDPHCSIVALATPPGPAVRAVLRLTGPTVWTTVRSLLAEAAPGESAWDTSLPTEPTRGQWSAALRLPGLEAAWPVSVTSWVTPRSFTGQDLVEISCLGAVPFIDHLLATLLAAGLRLAEPGEFLFRAFLAGKVGLGEVSTLHDLLGARTRYELRQASRHTLSGARPPLARLRNELLRLLAEVEAGLDFADEGLTFVGTQELRQKLSAIHGDLTGILTDMEARKFARPTFRVVLVGPPNAGKSSLFNALAGSGLALVSPHAGTTRDYLSACISLEPDVALELIDTAGRDEVQSAIPEGSDVAALAQSGTVRQWEAADLVLWCQPVAAVPLAAGPTTSMTESGRTWLIHTKIDLTFQQDRKSGATALPSYGVSSLKGEGLAGLKAALAQAAREHRRGDRPPPLARALELLQAGRAHLASALALVAQDEAPELLALELRLALDTLGQIVGAVHAEELLGQIFSQFCIGK